MWDEPGWYDRGGLLPPGLELVCNDSGEDIPIYTAEQVRQGLDYMKRTYGKPEDEA
jgi:hypothetical protein